MQAGKLIGLPHLYIKGVELFKIRPVIRIEISDRPKRTGKMNSKKEVLIDKASSFMT
jgi:hypothetical protein